MSREPGPFNVFGEADADRLSASQFSWLSPPADRPQRRRDEPVWARPMRRAIRAMDRGGREPE